MALSLGLPRPGVTRHRFFMESGLSSNVAARDHPAIRTKGDLGAGAGAVNGIAPGEVNNQGQVRTVQRTAFPRPKPCAHC